MKRVESVWKHILDLRRMENGLKEAQKVLDKEWESLTKDERQVIWERNKKKLLPNVIW